MIIERFFGKNKGRAGQAKPRVEAEVEPKPRRAHAPMSEERATVPRSEAIAPPTSMAPSADALAERSPDPARAPAPAAVVVADPTYEEIAARAYELWLAQGRPEGREGENWIEAERQLRAERATG